MIDLREIRETIDDIRRHGTTIGQAEQLALLYIAADHMEREEGVQDEAARYSRAAAPERVSVEARSDFLAACDGLDVQDALEVLDEHMEAIRVLYPKEYAAVVRRLEGKR